MNICENNISVNLENIIRSYNDLNNKLKLDVDDNTKYTFESQCELVRTLVGCREIITATLKVYTYITEGTEVPDYLTRTRDLYKHSKIKVTHAIIYHDLKNVFEILDIAASEKSNTITLHNITEPDLENVYAAMVSFILQAIEVYNIKFGTGGTRRRGPRKRETVHEEVY